MSTNDYLSQFTKVLVDAGWEKSLYPSKLIDWWSGLVQNFESGYDWGIAVSFQKVGADPCICPILWVHTGMHPYHRPAFLR